MNTIALKNLRPGKYYPGGSINSRRYTPTEVRDMEGQLIGHGLLQSLLIKTHPDQPKIGFVMAGNRRLEALTSLAKKKKLKDIPHFDPEAVPVVVRNDLKDGADLAASLTENEARIPLHPVDRFNTIAQMKARKMTVQDIATTLQTTIHIVNQSLELAKLSPKVRDAWLAGKIMDHQAAALTVTADHGAQERVLKTIRDHTRARDIKEALTGDAAMMAPLLVYVGEPDYLKAGGAIHKDLFGDKDGETPTVQNPDLLIKLMSKKIAPMVADLKKNGWKWAAPALELGSRHNWNYWPKANGGKNCTPAMKAKTGVIIEFDKAGKPSLTYGVLHRDDGYTLNERAPASKKVKEKKKKAAGGKPLVSAALMRDMSHWLTWGAQDALIMKAEPNQLLAMLVAATDRGELGLGSIDIRVGGLGGKIEGSGLPGAPEAPFAALLIKLNKPGAEQTKKLFSMLQLIIARSFDFQVFSGDRPPLADPDNAAVVNAIDPETLLTALRDQLRKNAERYFAGAGKAANLIAIKETLGPDTARQIGRGNGKQIAAFCAKAIPPTGWLPEAMRPKAYVAPKVKAAEQTCQYCGCTDSNACAGGCSWIKPGVCSNPKCLAKDAAGVKNIMTVVESSRAKKKAKK